MIEFLDVYRQHFSDWVPQLLIACVGTLQLMALSFMLASVIGLVVALMRVSRSRLLHGMAVVYVEVIRGMPALVILFLIYFGRCSGSGSRAGRCSAKCSARVSRRFTSARWRPRSRWA